MANQNRFSEMINALKELEDALAGNPKEPKSTRTKEIRREAFSLLVDNLPLINDAKNRYGMHCLLQKLLGWIEELASKKGFKDFGDYVAWDNEFIRPKLWEGKKSSFIDELERWDREAKQRKRPKKWTVTLANEAILPIIKEYAKTNPTKLTVRYLQQESSCPKSTIQKTDNWKAIQNIKRTFRDKQGRMQRKPVTLSDQMLHIAAKTESGVAKLHTSHKKKNIEGND